AAGDTEIDGNDIAGRAGGEEVAWMHVGVEKAIADGMPQETLHQVLGEQRPVEPGSIERFEIADRNAIHPASRQHVVGGVLPAYRRHDKAGIALGVFRDFRDRGGLEPEVELHAGRAVERRHDVVRPQAPRLRYEAFGEPGAGIIAFKVAGEALRHPGPENLDGDVPLETVAIDEGG